MTKLPAQINPAIKNTMKFVQKQAGFLWARKIAAIQVIRGESAWNIVLARSFYQVTRPLRALAGCGYLRLPVFMPNMWAMHLPRAGAQRSSRCAEAGAVCRSGFMDLVFSLGPCFLCLDYSSSERTGGNRRNGTKRGKRHEESYTRTPYYI